MHITQQTRFNLFFMSNTQAHNFTRSPVEEVFGGCFTIDSGSCFRTIPRPYPGWPHIRDEIRDMINETGGISRITKCTLRYTDRIAQKCLKSLSEPVPVASLLSGITMHQTNRLPGEEFIIRTSIFNTTGSVRSIFEDPVNPGWSLIFTMETDEPIRFYTREEVLKWFDDARAEIHHLFDLIVPEEIIQTIR